MQAEQTMQGKPGSSPKEEAESTRFRVLHISDIHFGSTFDTSVWEYVGGLIKRERPNLIACTGDIVDHGGLFMLAIARKEFEQLKTDTKVDFDMRCIRGNHDCGPWGNLKIPPFCWNYDIVFGADAMELPDWLQVPSFSRYKALSLPSRLLARFTLTIVLYALAMNWQLWRWTVRKTGQPSRLVRADDPKDVVLVYLDSNHQMLLASGNVDVRQVTRLKALLLNMRDEHGALSFAPRIALVHHHPLPIPDAKITEGLTSFEPFLVLRNAGVLLRELNRCDVDLVLHGHKHYSSFSRLGYSLDHHVEGEIAVLAAGSAGVTHAEQGRNSINFVDVYRSGRMAYTTIQFGAGGGQPVTELFRSTRYVHDMESHKKRMHRRAAERQGQWVERVHHRVKVDAGGDAVTVDDVERHHIERDLSEATVPLRIHVSMGRVSPNTFKLSEDSLRAGHKFLDLPQTPEKDINCLIDLGQQLAAPCPPQSYGFKYVSFNAYAVNEWETELFRSMSRVKYFERRRSQASSRVGIAPAPGNRAGQAPLLEGVLGANSGTAGQVPEADPASRSESNAGYEFTSFVVRVPVAELEFELALPDTALSPDPQVRVMRWSTYPDVPLDDYRHFVERNGEWVYDSDATQHEAGSIFKEDEHWTMQVKHPLVGHRYDIRWRVRGASDVDSGIELWRKGCAMQYRQALLQVDDGRRLELQQFLREFLTWLCKPLLVPLVPGAVDSMGVALFAYDETCRELRLVLSEPSSSSYENYSVPLNEGVVGAAFKRSAPVCYVHPELSGRHDDSAYLYDRTFNRVEMGRWRYLVALPIFASTEPFRIHDDRVTHGWLPAATVGVMTLFSESPVSGLARIAIGAPLRSPRSKRNPRSLPKGKASTELDYNLIWAYAHVLLSIFESPEQPGPGPDTDPASTTPQAPPRDTKPASEDAAQGVAG